MKRAVPMGRLGTKRGKNGAAPKPGAESSEISVYSDGLDSSPWCIRRACNDRERRDDRRALRLPTGLIWKVPVSAYRRTHGNTYNTELPTRSQRLWATFSSAFGHVALCRVPRRAFLRQNTALSSS